MNLIFFYLFVIFNIIDAIKIDNQKKFMTDVIIDLNGNYKYLLIEMLNKTNLNDYKYLVRGSNAFEYHKNL